MTTPASAASSDPLTPTCQDPADTGSDVTMVGLLAALEAAWSAIRGRHPEVPAAVLVVASGTGAGTGQTKWGHFASMRWQRGTDRLPEVLISGEGLARTPGEVLTTLLHEAAHGLADARKVQDTSRQGRWHNKRFAALATELGLDPRMDARLGWSPCTLRPDTAEEYRPILDQLAAALSTWRHAEPARTAGRSKTSNGVSCACDCPRKIRVSVSVLEAGPILCGVCDAAFLPEQGDV